MLRIILILPGTTDLDQQQRIKGSLDIPLNSAGAQQVERTVSELGSQPIDVIYAAPSLAAQQTALRLCRRGEIKCRTANELRNLDRGLWNGKSIHEMKKNQPRIYRQWLENPEAVCPPDGETVPEARQRIRRLIRKLRRRHRGGTIGLVVSEPLASIIRLLGHANGEMGNLWEAECRSGSWETFDLPADLAM